MTASPSSIPMAMMPPGSRVAEGHELGLLDDASLRAHDDVLLDLELLDRHQRGDALALFHRYEIGDRLAAPVGTDVGDLMDLEPVGTAAVREDHDVRVGRRHEQVADEVLLACPHADAALAAAALAAVVGDRGPLDVAGVADGDRHVLLGDQVLGAELAFLGQDLGAAIVAVLLLHRAQLVDDDLHQQALAGENGQQSFDDLEQLGQLVENLLPLEAGQPLQLHVEDRLRLDLRQRELRHQAVAGLARTLGRANERDDGIDVIERDLEPFEDVTARFGLAQLELGPAAHDFAPELDERVDQLDQRQHLGSARGDGEHDDPEAALKGGVLIEIVQHHLADFAALQIDDDAHSVAV